MMGKPPRIERRRTEADRSPPIPAQPGTDGSVSAGSPTREPDGGDAPQRSPAVLKRILRARAERNAHFGVTLFADPAWDILLDLYVAQLDQADIFITSLTMASNVPATTAGRYIGALTSAGLLAKVRDPIDLRRSRVALTGRGAALMESWLDRAVSGPL